jgi:Protein of unknown function (DUF2807).
MTPTFILIPLASLLLNTSIGAAPIILGLDPVCIAEETFLPSATEVESSESDTGRRSVKIVDAHMNLAPFTAIHSEMLTSIRYVPSDRYRIEAQGSERIINAIDVRVEKGVLHITAKDRLRLRRGERLSLTVYGRELSTIRLDGVGNFKCSETINTDKLEIVNSGVGNINLDDVQCNELVVKNEGVGNITLRGETNTATYMSDGVGSIYAYDLQSHDTTVSLSGIGSVQCHASERCDYTNNGVGNILYKGRPEMQRIHKNGVGSISPR